MAWKIDKNKCMGCGACVSVCPEGIEIINGKAKIKNENASCLKEAAKICPVGAFSNNNEKSNSKNVNPYLGPGLGGIGLGFGRRFRRGRGRGFGRRGRRGII